MKTCRRCSQVKQESEFPKNKAVPGGIDRMCKACWKSRKLGGRKFSGTVTAPPAPSLPPEGVEVVKLNSLANLVRDGWYYASTSPAAEAVEKYRAKYGINPSEVFEFNNTRFIKAPGGRS